MEYATASELVAASDAVVAGTVTSVADGSRNAAPEVEDFGHEQLVQVTLTLDTVIAGSGFSPGDTVTMERSGYEVDRDGNASRLYVANGIPFPTVGSVEVWFLKDYGARGWGPVDIDDGRFERSGNWLRALASTAGPAARDVEQLGVDGLLQLVEEGLDADITSRTGETRLAASAGPGWSVWGFERGRAIGDHSASIVTDERGLKRAWELGRFETSQPEVTFEEQVLIILTPGVSGSCPDIVFEDLVLGDHSFGVFAYPLPSEDQGCTADFNPVTFFFIVERQALSEMFRLSVSTEFDSCQGCTIGVDLTDEAALELELWGASTLALATAGAPPPDGAFNVVQWTVDGEVGALLFGIEGWSEFPTWFQSFGTLNVEHIEGFVASCTADQCEECEGDGCAALPRLGEACSQSYEATLFEDQTFVVTFDGTSCSINVVSGVLGRDG